MKGRIITRCTVAALAPVLAAGTWLGSGSSAAAPDRTIPLVSNNFGDTFGTFGDHAYCRGVVRFTLTAPAHKRGWVRINLTSLGFTGSGASWTKNPKCRGVMVVYHLGSAGSRETHIPYAYGPRRGEKVTRLLFVGSGLLGITMAPYALNTAVRTPQGQGMGYYAIVP